MKQFSAELTGFIEKFLSEVDTDLHLTLRKQTTIMEQVERKPFSFFIPSIHPLILFLPLALIEVHFDSLESLRSALKKSSTAKVMNIMYIYTKIRTTFNTNNALGHYFL